MSCRNHLTAAAATTSAFVVALIAGTCLTTQDLSPDSLGGSGACFLESKRSLVYLAIPQALVEDDILSFAKNLRVGVMTVTTEGKIKWLLVKRLEKAPYLQDHPFPTESCLVKHSKSNARSVSQSLQVAGLSRHISCCKKVAEEGFSAEKAETPGRRRESTHPQVRLRRLATSRLE
jgi:hypothetical protein